MATFKFITLANLTSFWTKAKEYITGKFAELTASAPSDADGKFVSEVTQTNGKVSVKYKDIQISDVTGLETKLSSLDTETTNSVVTVEESAGSGDILKVYTIKQGGSQVGVTIDIPRDFLVKSGEVTDGTGENNGKKVLKLVLNAKEGTGNAQSVEIPVDSLCDVYTPGDGLAEASNKFSVKKDPTSESFLVVSSEGVKITGVQAAIDAAKGELTTKIESIEEDLEDLLGEGEGSVSDQIDSALEDLTVATVGDEDKFIQTVSQTNGKLSAKAVSFSDIFTSVSDEDINGLFS